MMDTFVARAPVRVSFGGGGTDLEAYYARFGGFVVSSAIARYAYVVARETVDRSIHLSSSDYRVWQTFRRGEMPIIEEPLSLPKAVVERFGPFGLRERGVDLFLASEVAPGTGLGSSSAMAVALVRALSAYLGLPADAEEVAEVACFIEIDRLDMPIGKQDQYASAFGGLNAITFTQDGVEVEPLRPSADTITALCSRLMLFSTGHSRHSSSILREQRAATAEQKVVAESLHAMKALAMDMREALFSEDLTGFGTMLDHGWQMKRRLSGKISSPEIDAWYAAAREAGALGGKITGAGGGGYMLLYCPVERQDDVREVLAVHRLREMPFDFDFHGAHLLTDVELSRPAMTPPDIRRHVYRRSERGRHGVEAKRHA
jgi:D-glycero-alpha-D-manno-heptose-7-phosphate kinase